MKSARSYKTRTADEQVNHIVTRELGGGKSTIHRIERGNLPRIVTCIAEFIQGRL